MVFNWENSTRVEYHVEYILCVVSSDDSEIQQAYDRETDSILAMPIVSFFSIETVMPQIGANTGSVLESWYSKNSVK